MKTYSEFLSELSIQQRLKRSRTMKVKAKIIARKRQIAMKKPPSPERIEKNIKRQVRQKALAIVDKQGQYADASPGLKKQIELKADKKVQKMGSKWTKILRPQVRKQMKAAYKERMSSSNPEL